MLAGHRGFEDAGVFRIDAERALVQTVDFFPPIVDDPRWFWHPPACFGSLLGTLWGWQTQRSRGSDRNIRDLKVDQTLKGK